jgi:hypothetical protein
MKRLYIPILIALIIISLNSCSTYKNSATPDDVYYSPGKQAAAAKGDQTNNSEYYNTPNENYVQMRVQDPDKWSYFDDYNYDYYGNSYYSPGYSYGAGFGLGLSMGFGMGFGSIYNPWYGGFGYYSPMSFYNSYYAWNSFYNPYYGGVIIVSGKNMAAPSYTRMANFNPTAYSGRYYNSRPTTNFYNPNTTRSQNSNFTRPYNNSNSTRPTYSPSYMRSSSPSNFSGGGGAMRGGGFSRPGR